MVPKCHSMGTRKPLILLSSRLSSPDLSDSSGKGPPSTSLLTHKSGDHLGAACIPFPPRRVLHSLLCSLPGADLGGPHPWAPSAPGSKPVGRGRSQGEWREAERSVSSFPSCREESQNTGLAWPPLKVTTLFKAAVSLRVRGTCPPPYSFRPPR